MNTKLLQHDPVDISQEIHASLEDRRVPTRSGLAAVTLVLTANEEASLQTVKSVTRRLLQGALCRAL